MERDGTGTRLDWAGARAVLPRMFDPVEVAEFLPSTMVRAAELAAAGAPDGAIVLADCQTAGRGRLGRTWATPPGTALMLSVVLRPALVPARSWTLLAAAGVALVDAVGGLLGAGAPPVRLKWPNDLLVGGRKAAGLLADRHGAVTDGVMVLGMGVNVSQRLEDFPEELRAHATSLALAAPGRPPDRLELLGAWARAFLARYRALGPDGAGILPEYRGCLDTLGRQVRVERLGDAPLLGRAVDVRPDGGLVVETGDGAQVTVATGDVHHLRPA